MEVPTEILVLLSNTQSLDQALRSTAEERLKFFEQNELEFPLLLTSIAVDQKNDRLLRQGYVLHSWSLSSERYTPNSLLEFLPQEQKEHIRQAMINLLVSEDHVIRDLAANIVPKIAQADWPNDWPRFLEQLAAVLERSTDVTQIISALKVLREFISETLTDDSYFTIVPPIMEHLLVMQSDKSLLVRAKAQSVFRACIEQMEMYKDTKAYQDVVRRYIDDEMGPWVAALLQNLSLDVTSLSGHDYDAAMKLNHANYKTLALLERAFESHLLFYIPPLLEAAFKNLDAIYPYYYQALASGALPPQLTRYITDIFGIVQTILRAPQFDGLPLGHVYSSLFFHSVKFAQLSDETVTQWLEDPYYILEESADSIATTAVRAVVLHCALEHFLGSFTDMWVQYYNSIRGDWRAEEAAFCMIVPIVSSEPAQVPDNAAIRAILEEGMKSTNPVLCSTAIYSGFMVANYYLTPELYASYVEQAYNSPAPIVKIQCINAINQSLDPKSISGPDFEHYVQLQRYTIPLIESLIQSDVNLSSLLIPCLCAILQIDASIVYSTSAMDLIFHFLVHYPQNPMTQNELLEALNNVLRSLWSNATGLGGTAAEWLGKAGLMINVATQKQKDDPFTPVAMGTLAPFLEWWVGPLPDGVMNAVFPSVVEILMRDDDTQTIMMGQRCLQALISIPEGYEQISRWTSSDGKSGLEVLMMLIQDSLLSVADENQRVLAGPLIADLVQKANADIQPHLPTLLNIVIHQLAGATAPLYIQSLIHVFAILLVIHTPGEILSFCSNIQIAAGGHSQTGLEVLLKTWTETFEVIQGYSEIRYSVVALSRVFEYGVEGIMVKGDEITEPSKAGRIVTRSQRRHVQYTSIPVSLKILKLFIKELSNISEGENGNGGEERPNTSSSGGNADEGWDSDDDDDGEWEDDTENSDTVASNKVEPQQDLLKGVDTKTYIVDFLKKVAASGVAWELSESEIEILRAAKVI